MNNPTKPIKLPPQIKTEDGAMPSAFVIVETHASTSSRQSVQGQHVVTAALLDGQKVRPMQWRLGMN